MKRYVYTALEKRAFRRLLLRMVRAARFRNLVEYGQLDLGGESGL